ncbi:MAG: biotin transporter BioY [Coriobacteriia bacterium]|nr:biotin transporter BioY [Coriobacteriia bacterium]
MCAQENRSKTRSMAYVALCIAIMAVSAWVTVPIGPVPVTLQMFAFTFAIVILRPSECLAATAGYLLLGAVGLPLFSGMQGGLAKLMGPTGGFLWGYIFGVAAATALLAAVRKSGLAPQQKGEGSGVGAFLRNFGWEILAGVVFTAIAYVCGTFQFTVVMNASVAEALAACVLPFVLIDFGKIVAAVLAADAVRAVIRR